MRGTFALASAFAPAFVLASAIFALGTPDANAVRPPRAPQGHYDEVYLPSGEARPHYRAFLDLLRPLGDLALRRFERETREDFGKDNPMSLIPRAFGAAEFDDVLRRGVAQRGRVIRALIADHYSGAKRYEREGVIPAAVMARILRRNVEAHYQGQLNPDQIGFIYGPDIVRGPDGAFRALEDNVGGDTGGLGDLQASLEFWIKNAPAEAAEGLLPLYERARDPGEFYAEMADAYRARARGGRVLVMIPPPHTDQEDVRLARVWAAQGIDLVTTRTKRRLVIRDDGVFVREPGLFGGPGKLERVGLLVLQAAPVDIEPTDPLIRATALTEHARHIERLVRVGHVVTASAQVAREFIETMDAADPVTGIPNLERVEELLRKMDRWAEFAVNDEGSFRGLFAAWRKGLVELNNAPGIEFVNDKELCLYMNELTRLYLGEDAILPSIPGRTFARRNRAGREVLDEAFAGWVSAHRERLVLKPASGRGGIGITIGPRVSQSEFDAAIAEAKADFRDVIAQDLVPMSVVGDQLVDVRVYASVPPTGEPITSNIGWSRGASTGGSGRVNVAQGGGLLPVYVPREEPEPAGLPANGRALAMPAASESSAAPAPHDAPRTCQAFMAPRAS